MFKSRKGQGAILGGTAAAIISGIAILGLVLFAMVNVVDTTKDSYGSQDIQNSVVNESFTAGATVKLSSPAIQVGTLTVYNASGRSPVNLNNFTIDYTSGTINLTTAGAAMYNGRTLNATYVGLTRSAAYNMSLQGSVGLGNVATYQPTIAIILAAIAVISLVIGVFAFSRFS